MLNYVNRLNTFRWINQNLVQSIYIFVVDGVHAGEVPRIEQP